MCLMYQSLPEIVYPVLMHIHPWLSAIDAASQTAQLSTAADPSPSQLAAVQQPQPAAAPLATAAAAHAAAA